MGAGASFILRKEDLEINDVRLCSTGQVKAKISGQV